MHPTQVAAHLPPQRNSPRQQKMLSLQLLRPEMVIQLRSFPLQDPHELVNLNLEAIEVTSVQLIVLVIH